MPQFVPCTLVDTVCERVKCSYCRRVPTGVCGQRGGPVLAQTLNNYYCLVINAGINVKSSLEIIFGPTSSEPVSVSYICTVLDPKPFTLSEWKQCSL